MLKIIMCFCYTLLFSFVIGTIPQAFALTPEEESQLLREYIVSFRKLEVPPSAVKSTFWAEDLQNKTVQRWNIDLPEDRSETIHLNVQTGKTVVLLGAIVCEGSEKITDSALTYLERIYEHARFVLINSTDDTQKTLLMCAVNTGKAAAVKKLLEWGADQNKADKNGDTALHYFVQSLKLDITILTHLTEALKPLTSIDKIKTSRYLLLKNKAGRSALEIAKMSDHQEAFRILFETLQRTSLEIDTSMPEELQSHLDWWEEFRPADREFLMLIAARTKRMDFAKKLIGRGAPVWSREFPTSFKPLVTAFNEDGHLGGVWVGRYGLKTSTVLSTATRFENLDLIRIFEKKLRVWNMRVRNMEVSNFDEPQFNFACWDVEQSLKIALKRASWSVAGALFDLAKESKCVNKDFFQSLIAYSLKSNLDEDRIAFLDQKRAFFLKIKSSGLQSDWPRSATDETAGSPMVGIVQEVIPEELLSTPESMGGSLTPEWTADQSRECGLPVRADWRNSYAVLTKFLENGEELAERCKTAFAHLFGLESQLTQLSSPAWRSRIGEFLEQIEKSDQEEFVPFSISKVFRDTIRIFGEEFTRKFFSQMSKIDQSSPSIFNLLFSRPTPGLSGGSAHGPASSPQGRVSPELGRTARGFSDVSAAELLLLQPVDQSVLNILKKSKDLMQFLKMTEAGEFNQIKLKLFMKAMSFLSQVVPEGRFTITNKDNKWNFGDQLAGTNATDHIKHGGKDYEVDWNSLKDVRAILEAAGITTNSLLTCGELPPLSPLSPSPPRLSPVR